MKGVRKSGRGKKPVVDVLDALNAKGKEEENEEVQPQQEPLMQTHVVFFRSGEPLAVEDFALDDKKYAWMIYFTHDLRGKLLCRTSEVVERAKQLAALRSTSDPEGRELVFVRAERISE